MILLHCVAVMKYRLESPSRGGGGMYLDGNLASLILQAATQSLTSSAFNSFLLGG
jgi:hypothetical protein